MINYRKYTSGVLFLIVITSLTTIYACTNNYRYLEKRSFVECEFVGFKNLPSESYPKYERFRDETEINVLTSIANEADEVIKTYAYWALIEKLDKGYLEIFSNLLNDSTKVSQKCGCTYGKRSIAYSTYNNYWSNQINFDLEDFDKPLIDSEKLFRIDSLILTQDDIEAEFLSFLLTNKKYKDKIFLEKIIWLAFELDDRDAKEYIRNNINDSYFQEYKEKILNLDATKLSKPAKKFAREIELILIGG